MKNCKLALGSTLLAIVMFCHAHPVQAASIDLHAIPLGDGKVSSYPEAGYVYSCRSNFRGGGARHVGPWIHGYTWDATQKIHVQGDVPWPDALFRIHTTENSRDIMGNGLPVAADTGIFPIQPSDPAYQIDRNPNAIEAQHIRISLPLKPQIASTPSCLPMGMVGVMLNGVALYDAVDDAGRDAVAHEVQDKCNGHPQHQGEYHYHGPSPCVPNIDGKAKLVGYALDGFGIYSMRDENGRELTDKDLDACHGRTSPVMWNGKLVDMYHYVMTREYPYSIGCFMGTPVLTSTHTRSRRFQQHGGFGQGGGRGFGQGGGQGFGQGGGRGFGQGGGRGFGQGGGRGGGRRGPPPMAVQACAGHMRGDSCQFDTPRGRVIEGICRSPAGELACVPQRRR